MATHASALKAHRQSLAHRERNRRFRSQLRTKLKVMQTAIAGKDLDTARAQLSETFSLVDRMATKGVIHDNAAARYKSRLHTRLARASQS